MDTKKRQRLEAAGYTVYDDVNDWLKLSDEDRKFVEFRIALSRAVRDARDQSGLTQADLAKKMKTSQPCIARIEAGVPGVSLDLSIKALFALGGGLDEIFRASSVTQKKSNQVKTTSQKKTTKHKKPALLQ